MSKRKKILIVDDNTANLTTCKTVLKDLYDVYTAISAVSMMSLLKNVTPDLIMMDIRMPDINGYDAARLLKSDDSYKDIPIIFVSALSDVESEMEGLELGAVDYISKPYFPPILIQRIKTSLELVNKTKQLEIASQAKSDFLANISHEMRTPLNAVLGLTELIHNTVHLDEETSLNLTKIHRAGETLLNLINDILDISKIEIDKLKLHPAEYDVVDMLDDTITQSMQYKPESKPVDFVINIAEDIPGTLYGDEMRVKQIFNNLLSNAFKYTQEGTVTLSVKCEKDADTSDVWLDVQVCDTGIGIEAEDIDKLFNTYSRIEKDAEHSSSDRRTEGTGLGLYISKNIAEIMGGTITVESEYKKGSCFTARLKQRSIGSDVIGKDIAQELSTLHFVSRQTYNTDKSHINMSYANVLVVDDNLTNLEVAKGLIGLYGIKVDCMTSGQQAVEAVRNVKTKYNAIFVDHLMPGLDGIETARIIRNEIGTDYAKTVPLIALTANALPGNEEMFLKAGFQAFMPKPVSLALLESVLMQWVRDMDAESLLAEKSITVTRNRLERKLLSGDIPGLDIKSGISRFGGSEISYIRILKVYVEDTRQLLEQIENPDFDDLSEYITIIHGIKGASLGICAKAVGDSARALETAVMSGDTDYVKANNPQFIKTVSKLLTDIEYACAGAEAP